MSITRREFMGVAGAIVGTALVPVPMSAAEPSKPIRLDSNENPYGPSKRAQDAMAAARSIAARYPDDLEDRVGDAIAKLHAVRPENVLLGCGSGEILRMADLAFLGSGRTERLTGTAHPGTIRVRRSTHHVLSSAYRMNFSIVGSRG